MIIHTVESGDTIYSISKQYGITETRIITDNFLDPTKKLVQGQTLIISRPCKTCAVRGGDTIESIAKENNISVLSILQNNPLLSPNKLIPSQTLNLSYDRTNSRRIAVAAYTGGATADVVEKYLPYLSILIVQNAAHINGNKISVTKDAPSTAALARKYRAMPMLAIECINERGRHDGACLGKLLASPADTESLISSIVDAAKSNGYAGIEVNSSGIAKEDEYKFTDMLLALSGVCRENDLYCSGPIIPISSFGSSEENIMDIADMIPLWSYIWDNEDFALPAAPLDKIIDFLEKEIALKFNNKLLLGIPTFGIDYIKTPRGYSKSIINSADGIRLSQRGTITTEFDEATRTPFIRYRENQRRNGSEHIVHFEDARSISEKLDIVDKYDLYGVNIMSLEYEAPVIWQMLNQRYNILKF